MTTELEGILDSNLVTTVFLYGSAAFFIAALVVVTWILERKQYRAAERAEQARAAFFKIAPRSN